MTTPLWIRQPMKRPVTDMTATPMLEWMSAAMLRDTKIDDRRIGSERSRSTMPLPMSVLSPMATMKALNAIVCAMIPGRSQGL